MYKTHIHNPQPTPPFKGLPLTASRPHVLEVTVALRQPVQRVIALAARAHKTAQGVGLVLAGVAAVLVDLGDGDLDGAVVVGLDDAVGGRALAGDVAGHLVSRDSNCVGGQNGKFRCRGKRNLGTGRERLTDRQSLLFRSPF